MNEKHDKLRLAATPTPVYRLNRLSEELGKSVWIKRDDMTGTELSGNKVRKLEYLFADALNKGCNCVLTCGGKQSNHCRAVAAVAAKLNVKCVLFLSGDDDKSYLGNLLMDKLFGAETVFVPKERFGDIDEIMKDAAKRLTEEGISPYVIPLGGSNAIGSLGYADAFYEIADYERENNVFFDTISLAAGSGGTYAGILAGALSENADCKREILGISVLAEKRKIEQTIAEIALEMGVKSSENHICVTDSYIGEGYGIASAEVMELIKKIAVTEGILLDPVYTGKAMHGLISEISSGKLRTKQNILFVHTGGIYGIFGHLQSFNI